MSELKQEFLQRSITAIFISAIVITLILYSSNLILNIFISILSLALFLEWMSVSKSSNGKRLIFLILFIILISANHYFGGLFEPINDYNWEESDIKINNDILKKILDVFDQYNFTVNEEDPIEKEVAINPEMLGHIFESLIEENLQNRRF